MGLANRAFFNMKRVLRGRFAAFGLLFFTSVVSSFQPEFAEPIINITVPLGRDATFRCLVVHLGGYRVGWVKADTKAIQAIHDHVITHNPRVSVSHTDHSTWNLHIRAVVEDDQGQYMCQINTDPMKSVKTLSPYTPNTERVSVIFEHGFNYINTAFLANERPLVGSDEKWYYNPPLMGTLEVVIPPDFIPEDTSGDLMVPEGGSSRLACRARGSPEPRVIWRREDGNDIIVKEPTGLKSKVSTYQGEVLMLSKVTRSEMGAYLCIASNGVPPSVSKRIMVNVHFHPVIQVPNQLVGAPLGTDVTLECYVEASPKSINYWLRDSNEMVINSYKYVVNMAVRSLFETKMTLTILRLQSGDAGGYRCVAKNSLGEVESNIRLYEIPGPTRKAPVPRFEENEDEDLIDLDGSPNNQFGSAENDDEESDDDEKNNFVSGRPRQNQQSSKTSGKDSASVNQPSSTGKGKHNNKHGFGSKNEVSKTNSKKNQCNLTLVMICCVLLQYFLTVKS